MIWNVDLQKKPRNLTRQDMIRGVVILLLLAVVDQEDDKQAENVVLGFEFDIA